MILVDPAAAAAGTGIPPRTIRRWVTSGWIARHGSPRRLLVDLQEVAKLAETRRDGRLPDRDPVA